jgi:ribonuclease T2
MAILDWGYNTAGDGVRNAVSATSKFVSSSVLPSEATMASSLPSMRALTKLAFTGVNVLLGGQRVLGGTPQTCSNPQLSCHNTTAVADLCCFNAPGGQLLQTQFWDTDPATGPDDSWTIHGLW